MSSDYCAVDRDAANEQTVANNERGIPRRDPVIAAEARGVDQDWNNLLRSIHRDSPHLTSHSREAIERTGISIRTDFADARRIEMASLAQRRELLEVRSADEILQAAKLAASMDKALDALRSTLMQRKSEAWEDARHWAQRGATPWSRNPAPSSRTEFHTEKAFLNVTAEADRIRVHLADVERSAGRPMPAKLVPEHAATVYQDRRGTFAAVVKPGDEGVIRAQLENGDVVSAQYRTSEFGTVHWGARIERGTVDADDKPLTATDRTLHVDLVRPLAKENTADQESSKHSDRSGWELGGEAGAELNGNVQALRGPVARVEAGASAHANVRGSLQGGVEQGGERTHVRSSEGPQLREKVSLTFRVEWSEPPTPQVHILRPGDKGTAQ